MSANPYLGQITTFGFNFAPRGWATCQGQLLPISQNNALFSLLGTTYGGDGRTTFGLPDLRGRTVIGQGNGPGLSNIRWGARAGAGSRNLTSANMPSHNHSYNQKLNASDEAGDLDNPALNFLAEHGGAYNEDQAGERTLATSNVGSGTAFSVRNPYLGMYPCIATVGVYPSRS
ncbi:phage tail protein [Croceivirga thetidis]|uniref:Phage tail protein n=1 Tax=Croceivirga thetidis TaxID=2721623 RepID=A0ABX1GQR1_9FLAO|nr:tail fiber protein [Croceivirga thetidis]NKI31949.1 phage tail protein [Croceivirga thetidis]